MTEFVNIFEDKLMGNRVSLEKLFKERAYYCIVLRHGSQKFNHLCEMIVCLTVILTFSWIEKEITRNKLKYHTSKRPEICTCIIVYAKHNFRASILTSLDLLCEMMMCPAPITHITDLEIDSFIS